MTANTAVIPSDANGKPVLALQNDATGQVIPVHVGSTVTGADGQTYAKLDVQASVTATPPASVVSTLNSTTTLLTANAVYTGTSESALQYGSISVEVFADQASAANGLVVQQSQDNINWDTQNSYSVLASTAFQQTINLVGQYFRVKYTNGTTNQGAFRLQTIKMPAVTSTFSSNQRVNAQSGDFVAGSIADLATVAGAVSGGKMLTSNYIGGSLVSVSNPYPSADQIRLWVMAGQAFTVTTGMVATGATNAYIGMEALWNNVAKNVFIYNVYVGGPSAGTDLRLYQGTTNTLDTGLTVDLIAASAVMNQMPSSGTASVVTSVKGSPAATTQISGFVGNLRGTGAAVTNSALNFFQQGSGLYIPKTTIGFLAAYTKVGTSGNFSFVTFEWVEF